MNKLAINKPTIALCFYVTLSGEKKLKAKIGDQPYSFLNSLSLKEGEMALTRRSNGQLSIVQIGRNVAVETRAATEKVTQPLLAKAELDFDRIQDDYSKIAEAKSAISESARQSRIDELLKVGEFGQNRVPVATDKLFES